MELNIDEKYTVLMEILKDCAIYTLNPEGNITSWSEGAQLIKGYRPEEVLNRNFSIVYPGGRESRPLRASLAGRGRKWTF